MSTLTLIGGPRDGREIVRPTSCDIVNVAVSEYHPRPEPPKRTWIDRILRRPPVIDITHEEWVFVAHQYNARTGQYIGVATGEPS